jgi:hypothetical protein
VPLLSAIYFAYVARNAFVATLLAATLVASFVYHLCQSAGACLFAAPISDWQFVDHLIAWSNFIILAVVFVQSTTGGSRTVFTAAEGDAERKRHREIVFWSEATKYAMLIFVFVVVAMQRLTGGTAFGDSTVNLALVVVTGIAMFTFMYVLIVAKGVLLFYSNFDWRYILPGILLAGVGVTCFLIVNDSLYWLLHSLWHLCTFVAWNLLLIGTNAHLFRELIAASCCCCGGGPRSPKSH